MSAKFQTKGTDQPLKRTEHRENIVEKAEKKGKNVTVLDNFFN